MLLVDKFTRRYFEFKTTIVTFRTLHEYNEMPLLGNGIHLVIIFHDYTSNPQECGRIIVYMYKTDLRIESLTEVISTNEKCTWKNWRHDIALNSSIPYKKILICKHFCFFDNFL